ncbi:hypothetical protein GIW46_07255 [Pseudomonas syringae]|uniref:hypothetical protein n=1 Tax=Pseudomonas syringae TaxID=317 RepID=UPI002FDA30F1|nr:hypothetical protein [Pseudomonas syringae]
MGNVFVDVMPPAYWQDFERLTLDYARTVWKDDYAERNGRQGQAQAGVDVSGYNSSQKEQTGIQCKKRIWKTKPGADAPSSTLTRKEIDDEINAARSFFPELDRFVISTTGPKDAELQQYVREFNRNKKSGFSVSLIFWEDYVEFLNNNQELMYRYYENVLKYRQTYDPVEHYYLLLHMAFNRPAIRTPFHLENRAKDFIDALAATQNAIATGCLKDRDNHVIDQAIVPKNKPRQLSAAAKLLQRARDISTKALADKLIIEHASVIEIRDRETAEKLNELRSEAVRLLNEILAPMKLPTISIDSE